MRHAGEDTLRSLEPLLGELRAIPWLTERRPGVFYCRSKAFLHFHEDDAGIFADLRLHPDEPFIRLRTTTRQEQRQLVRSINVAAPAAEDRSSKQTGRRKMEPGGSQQRQEPQ